jgi:hypothetical protein
MKILMDSGHFLRGLRALDGCIGAVPAADLNIGFLLQASVFIFITDPTGPRRKSFKNLKRNKIIISQTVLFAEIFLLRHDHFTTAHKKAPVFDPDAAIIPCFCNAGSDECRQNAGF